MKPFCPVCRRRVDTWTCNPDAIGPMSTCRDCGVAFNPETSERLAVKCDKCGEDLVDHGVFLALRPAPCVCDKCRKP